MAIKKVIGSSTAPTTTTDSGTNSLMSWLESTTAGANVYAVRAEALASKLSLKGTGDKIFIDGDSSQYQIKLISRTVTLLNTESKQKITITLADATKASAITDVLVFTDGSVNLSTVPNAKAVAINLGTQSLTSKYVGISTSIDQSNEQAFSYFGGVTGATGSTSATGVAQTFTLTEVAPTLQKTFLWSGVDTSALRDMVSYANTVNNRGGNLVTTTTSNDSTVSDQTKVGAKTTFFDPAYVNLLDNLITNVATYDNLVDEKLTYNPAYLSTGGKTVGVMEAGNTGAGDDTIVAGTSFALNGAYLNGGAGVNTLQVEMKGPFAQPKQLLNIQTVNVHNVSNYYDPAFYGLNNTTRTTADHAGTGGGTGSLTTGSTLDPTSLQLKGTLEQSNGSILDLTNAASLSTLVVTESGASGGLTVLGIKNYPLTKLEGSFNKNVVLHYTTGQKAVLNLQMVNVDFTSSINSNDIVNNAVNLNGANTDNSKGYLDIAHNAGAVSIDSQGYSNHLDNVYFGNHFQQLTVTGSGKMFIDNSLNFDMGAANIDASTNTGGLFVKVAASAVDAHSPALGANVLATTTLNAINIKGSTVNDVITIDSANVKNGAVLKIDLGAGDDNQLIINNALNAGAKSVITGSNLTVNIIQNAATATTAVESVNLTRADISGVQSFVIKDTLGAGTPQLTVTAAQFKALGAEKFVADHNTANALHNTSNVLVNVKIVVTADTDLSSLGDLTKLDSGVKLSFDIAKNATLTMTAAQLDQYVAVDGIVLSDAATVDGGGVGSLGKVKITDAGLNFDVHGNGTVAAPEYAYNMGGTISTGWTADNNITVIHTVNGYDRPSADKLSDTLTIDSGAAPIVVNANALVDPTQFNANVKTLIIKGANDVNFTAPVKFGASGDNFNIDASGLTGKLSGLKIVDFNKITLGTSKDWGNIKGTAGVDRINVTLSGNVGLDTLGTSKGGLKSTGVEQYVVTDLGGDNRTFNVCDSTQGYTTLGLQGNAGKSISFNNAKFGVNFLLEGDGKGAYSEVNKAAGNPNYSNVGTLNARYYLYDENFNSNVTINNQGVALGLQTDGVTTRTLHVDGINIYNSKIANITVTDGNAFISGINAIMTGISATATNELQVVKLTSLNDVTVELNANATNFKTFDASGVAAAKTVTVVIGNADAGFTPAYGDDSAATVDLSATSLVGVDAIKIVEAGTLTLTLAQIKAIGTTNITVVDGKDAGTIAGTTDGTTADSTTVVGGDASIKTANPAVLNVAGLDESEFRITSFSAGVQLGTIKIVDRTNDGITGNETVTLAATTDLTGATKITVPAGMTLNLTAAQFQQMSGKGLIDNYGTVNITDLKQADVDKALDLNNPAGLDLSGIANLGKGKYGTITLAENVVLKDGTILGAALPLTAGGNTAAGAAALHVIDSPTTTHDISTVSEADIVAGKVVSNLGFGIKLAKDQQITLANVAQAHNRVVTADTGVTGTKVTFGFYNTAIGAAGATVDFVDGAAAIPGLNLAYYNNIGTLSVNPLLVVNTNVEQTLGNLSKDTLVLIDAPNATAAQVNPTFRNVDVATGDTVAGSLAFQNLNYLDPKFVKLTDLALSLKGGSTITGALDIPGGLVASTGFNTLTINSQGTALNTIGSITAGTNNLATENNLLNVVVNATAALKGADITFTSIHNATPTNPANSATANLTIGAGGAGDVTFSHLDVSDDDVDVLNITNNSAGALNVIGGSPAILVSANDAETINIKGTGAINLGSVTKDAAGVVTDIDAGVLGDAAQPLTINASTATGAINLGTVTVLDDFTFTAGTGKTTLTLGGDDITVTSATDTSNDGDVTTAQLSEGDVWTIDLSKAAAGSTLTIDDSTDFDATGVAASVGVTSTKGEVSINLGTAGNNKIVFDGDNQIGDIGKFAITGTGTIQVKGALDFTAIDTPTTSLAGASDITWGTNLAISLDAGASVQMTDAQYAAFVAAGGTISGAGTTLLVNDAINGATTTAINLTTYRGVTAVKVVKNLTDTLKLTDDQAAVATITNADGTAATWDDPDVTGTTNPYKVGDFRDLAVGATITVIADGTANVNLLKGLDVIDIKASTSAAVTITDAQLPALQLGAAGQLATAGSLADLFNANSLSVIRTLANSVYDPGTATYSNKDWPIDFTLTHDAAGVVTGRTITGHAGAIASLSVTAGFTNMTADFQTSVTPTYLPTTITHTYVGSLVSTANGNIAGHANTTDKFSFVANADPSAVAAGGAPITSFNVTAAGTAPADVLDFSAFIGVKDVTGGTGNTTTLGGLGIGSTLDFSTNNANIISLSSTIGHNLTTAYFAATADTTHIKLQAFLNTKYVFIEDVGATANIYYVTSAADGSASSVSLVGTLNTDIATTLTTANFL